MADVTIYTRQFCGYCARAKSLLESKGVDFTEHDATYSQELRQEMIGKAKRMALRHGLAKAGDRVIVTAGVPFGTPGSTNVVHVARLMGDELDRHRKGEA